MCGRYTITSPDQLALRFQVEQAVSDGPRYNVAPSQSVPVVIAGRDGRGLEAFRWGFQPAWTRERSGPAPINARAETLLQRPFFRGALACQRCLMPADGFYEWQAVDGRKARQPFFIHLRDGGLFAFAGLYTPPTADAPGTCALITTAPNTLMRSIHDRMPAILRPEHEAAWLDPEWTEAEAVIDLLGPYADDLMEAFPVSARVSNVRNEGPDLVRPLV